MRRKANMIKRICLPLSTDLGFDGKRNIIFPWLSCADCLLRVDTLIVNDH